MSVLPALDPRPATVLHSGSLDSSPPRRAVRGPSRRRLSQVLLALSLLSAWVLLHLVVLSGLDQGHDQARLYDRLRAELAEGIAPTGAGAAAGAPVALISVPAVGLTDQVVVEGARGEQLVLGPGHVPGSVLPGQRGVSVVAGKSLTHGAPFAALPALEAGHVVEVTTQQGEFTYTVTGLRREGDPLPEALAPGAARLTLVTADRSPSRARGSGTGLSAGTTVYVDTELSGEAAAPGPVSGTDPEQRWMSPRLDTAAVTQLVLALQLLLVVGAAVAWSWTRWSRAATFLLGTPCVLAALWLASSVSSRLLPGLI